MEENFAAIPRLHPAVDQVIPVAIRRWRKKLLSGATWREISAFGRLIQRERYDLVIDTQGLVKSAFIARRARGPLAGYAADSAREPLAASLYGQHFSISRDLHAVVRNRQLVGAALGYAVEDGPDYGIAVAPSAADWLPPAPYVVFLTATSRDDKLWPDEHWLELGQALLAQGIRAVLPAGTQPERERAARLVAGIPGAVAAPPMYIPDLAAVLAGARAAIGVDTGLTPPRRGAEYPDCGAVHRDRSRPDRCARHRLFLQPWRQGADSGRRRRARRTAAGARLMARSLYSLILYLITPLIWLRLLWRARKQPEYLHHLRERYGFYRSTPPQGLIWVHAVSVGETRAAQPLIEGLLARWPEHRILLTCMTPTGRATGQEVYGERVIQAYLPYDYPGAVDRFFRTFRRPSAC